MNQVCRYSNTLSEMFFHADKNVDIGIFEGLYHMIVQVLLYDI